MPKKAQRDWLLTSEAAKYVGVSLVWFKQLVKCDPLPNTDQAETGILLFYKKDLDRMKAAREKKHAAQGSRRGRYKQSDNTLSKVKAENESDMTLDSN